jgi:molybdopterin-binding protein
MEAGVTIFDRLIRGQPRGANQSRAALGDDEALGEDDDDDSDRKPKRGRKGAGDVRLLTYEKADADAVFVRLGEQILRDVDGRVLNEVELVISHDYLSVEVASVIVARSRLKLTVGSDMVHVLKCAGPLRSWPPACLSMSPRRLLLFR